MWLFGHVPESDHAPKTGTGPIKIGGRNLACTLETIVTNKCRCVKDVRHLLQLMVQNPVDDNWDNDNIPH